nr:MAG TPA: hypothetical protein [Bacteriophage sp.]
MQPLFYINYYTITSILFYICIFIIHIIIS